MRKLTIDLSKHAESSDHECIVTKQGNWIIFTCPNCPGYERKFNLSTSEMKVQDPEQGRFRHFGQYCNPLLKTLN